MKLPAGAAARAWVHVAGDEPLVARRGVELPESFLRADRERQTTNALIAGVCGLLLIGGIVTGAIAVTRRPILLNDGLLDRRETLLLLGALVAFAVLGNLNSLPSALFSYDTSEPWSRFLGTKALGFVSAIPLGLALLGLWLGLGALRRRVGIPMLPGPASRSTSNDMLVAGLGLGALVYTMSRVGDLIPGKGIPHTPSTMLNDAVPMLGGIASLPATTMLIVALAGIPVLVVAGITPKWPLRVLIATVMLALVATMMLAMAPANDVEPIRVVLLAVMLAVVALAFYAWGTISASSWIVAALVQQGLGGVRNAVHAPTWQEQVANALVLILAILMIALLARRSRSEETTT